VTPLRPLKQAELSTLVGVPVILQNYRSRRKLFAQAGKRPTIFETWAKGFGAGPELKTFKDNRWWLLPVAGGAGAAGGATAAGEDGNLFVVMNFHSGRKLYSKPLKAGAKWEKDCGALPAEDTSPDTLWRLVQDDDTGAFALEGAYSRRKLFARMPHRGDKWSAGVGASPPEHISSETLWCVHFGNPLVLFLLSTRVNLPSTSSLTCFQT
jgi:hypothetical protein